MGCTPPPQLGLQPTLQLQSRACCEGGQEAAQGQHWAWGQPRNQQVHESQYAVQKHPDARLQEVPGTNGVRADIERHTTGHDPQVRAGQGLGCHPGVQGEDPGHEEGDG